MAKVKNISSETQAITGLPAFASGEVREMDEATAEFILANPNFVSADNKTFRAVEKEDAITGEEKEEETPSSHSKSERRRLEENKKR